MPTITDETIQAVLINGPRANEHENVPLPAPEFHDSVVLLDAIDDWEVRPGEAYGEARWERHRYRYLGTGMVAGTRERCAMYEHVERLDG